MSMGGDGTKGHGGMQWGTKAWGMGGVPWSAWVWRAGERAGSDGACAACRQVPRAAQRSAAQPAGRSAVCRYCAVRLCLCSCLCCPGVLCRRQSSSVAAPGEGVDPARACSHLPEVTVWRVPRGLQVPRATGHGLRATGHGPRAQWMQTSRMGVDVSARRGSSALVPVQVYLAPLPVLPRVQPFRPTL